MKLTITKDSFGPFSITATKEFDPKQKNNKGVTLQEHYLQLGLLHEMERTPSSKAESHFWTETNDKGKKQRGAFKRNMIPTTSEAAATIKATLEAEGYTDVQVVVRDVKLAGPAWKLKVSALVGMIPLGVMDEAQVRQGIGALAASTGVSEAEMLAHAKLG